MSDPGPAPGGGTFPVTPEGTVARADEAEPPVGRPRDRTIDRAVLDAALVLLDEVGYGRLTLDAVARRAGTTKPTVYRRWPTLHALLLDALADRLGGLDAPDTACTICDLNDAIKLYVDAFRRMPPDALASLLAECGDDAQRRAAFMAALFDPPRRAVGRTLDRAIARGDLREDVDRDLLLDLLASLVHYRALFGHVPNSDAEIHRAVDALLRGVSADYPRLLEISRTKRHRRHPHR